MKNSIYTGMDEYNSTPGDMFDRARTQIDTPFQYYDIDLSVARNNQIVNISGDFLFADLSTNGTAVIELNNQQDAADCPILFAAGMAFHAPFKQLKITNTGQAGANMRLMYSTGYSIIPSSSMANINQILQPVNINDVVSSQCQNYWTSINVPFNASGNGWDVHTVLTQANNVSGAIVRMAQLTAQAASNANCTMAKLYASLNTPAPTAASANWISGNNMVTLLTTQNNNNSPAVTTMEMLSSFRKIPAGWGLFVVSWNNSTTINAGVNADVSFELK